jgi:hypothetical protein
VSLAVEGKTLAGFYAWVNRDNFINALLFRVATVAPPPPVVHFPWFQTASVGNTGASHSEVIVDSDTKIAQYLAVRWDGDKIRGLRLVLTDGSTHDAGGINDTNYALTSYTFSAGETLQSLSLSSSGYGYGSLRRFQFSTSRGGNFAAGPQGIDDLVTPPAAGSRICGFHAWVNQDNFINAFAFRLTNDAPYSIKLGDYSPYGPTLSNGVVTINGKAAITIVDKGITQPPNYNLPYRRNLQITSGNVVGTCSFDGAATLYVSVFGDGTFEAKFTSSGTGDVTGFVNGTPFFFWHFHINTV